MGRKLLVVLLAIGAFSGYAAGCASIGYHHRERQAAFERHVAEVCVRAANATK